jgi:hypothetical protein
VLFIVYSVYVSNEAYLKKKGNSMKQIWMFKNMVAAKMACEAYRLENGLEWVVMFKRTLFDGFMYMVVAPDEIKDSTYNGWELVPEE